MIGPGLETWTTLLIAAALGGSIIRLTLRRRSLPVGARGPSWRFVALVVLQILAGVLLHLTLFPPLAGTPPGRLVVATDGTLPTLRASGDVLVALPEAGALPGAIRVPDLGTALRLNPGIGRLRIEGDGLTPRDQIPLDRPATFAPSPAPRGLVDLNLPRAVAPGASFALNGEVGTLPKGVVELLDPAGAIVDRAEVKADGRFSLSAATRAAGQALFELRIKDAADRLVEHMKVPVEARAQRQPRVLVLAGAAGPETKYLRRWAQDAGIDLRIQIDMGAGVSVEDAPTPLTRPSLAEVDLVIIDDRAWEALSPSARAALGAASRDGLGLLLKPTGPLSTSTRQDWAELGPAASGGDEVRAFPLEGRDLASATQLNRYDLAPRGTDGVPMIQDRTGVALAFWRSLGQGRVGLWTVADSFTLALTGQADRYASLWAEVFSTLARPGEATSFRLDGIARPGERAALCGVTQQVRVIDPQGVESQPRPDPATGQAACAAYWPRQPGWHRVTASDREALFYVHDAAEAPSLAQSANRQATADLVAAAPRVSLGRPEAPSSPWLWAGLLLAALGCLWSLERHGPRQA
jgi:hypothetical protein